MQDMAIVGEEIRAAWNMGNWTDNGVLQPFGVLMQHCMDAGFRWGGCLIGI
jgi:hypothetical protein